MHQLLVPCSRTLWTGSRSSRAAATARASGCSQLGSSGRTAYWRLCARLASNRPPAIHRGPYDLRAALEHGWLWDFDARTRHLQPSPLMTGALGLQLSATGEEGAGLGDFPANI